MAWLESHTNLRSHRKILRFAKILKISIPLAIGYLHLLWHAVLEQQEDGDLTNWDDEMISDMAGFKDDPKLFVMALQESKLMDVNTRLIHDWWNYVKKFLKSRYGKTPEKWIKIEGKYKDSNEIKDEEYPKITHGLPMDTPRITRDNITEHNITEQNKEKNTLGIDTPQTPQNPATGAPGADSGASSEPSKPKKYTIKNDIQFVMCSFKKAQGFEIDDRKWDSDNFGTWSKYAKQLLKQMNGDKELAALCIQELGKNFREAGLSWNFSAIVRNAPVWLLNHNKGHQ